jgi:hypothetical protein
MEGVHMRFELLTATAGPDGTLNFSAKGEPGRVYDVVVTLAVVANEAGVFHAPSPAELGWPPGYLESVVGSITDPAFREYPNHPRVVLGNIDDDTFRVEPLQELPPTEPLE